jgi:hypothetical protein
MRSASIVVAAEYVRAKGPHGRAVVSSVCARADEPAELLAYWLARHGRKLPMAIKRGVADAACRLYNEQSALKWDSSNANVRMGDVIELTHPRPLTESQSQLFHYLLDKRHKRDDIHAGDALTRLAQAHQFDAIPEDQRREWIKTNPLPELYTWERLSGWLPGGMDAEAWEYAIPNMGYMALLRNLRNFESTGVSTLVLDDVAKIIGDPAKVAESHQLPYRFWSAYKNSGTMRFGAAIESALEASVTSVPKFSGRTLVAVDTSGSMRSVVSSHSQVMCVEVAAVFAAAVGARSDIDLMIYADRGQRVEPRPSSVLRSVEQIAGLVGSVGHGTATWPSVLSQYSGQDRIIVFTDMQDNPGRVGRLPKVPVYVWDLRGYGVSNIEPGSGRYLLSGFNDASFGLVELLEAGKNANWPWEH